MNKYVFEINVTTINTCFNYPHFVMLNIQSCNIQFAKYENYSTLTQRRIIISNYLINGRSKII